MKKYFAIGSSTIYSPIRSATKDDNQSQNAMGLDQYYVEFLPTIAVLAQAKNKLPALSQGDIIKITNTGNGLSTFALVDNLGSGDSFADLTPETARRLGIKEVRSNNREKAPGSLTNKVIPQAEINDITKWEADHIIAYSKGGKTNTENCQLVCKIANRQKGSGEYLRVA